MVYVDYFFDTAPDFEPSRGHFVKMANIIAVVIALLNPLLERVWQAILLRYFDM